MVVDDDKMSRLVLKKFIDKTESLVLTHDLDNTQEANDILIGDQFSYTLT